MIRCFLAINLSTDTQSFISKSMLRWKSDYSGMVKWVRPENCHVTLKFLGNVKKATLSKIERHLVRVAASHNQFQITLSYPGVFPNKRFPRILWLGLKGDLKSLGRLQCDMERSLETLGFEAEKRSFVPHITVGRIKGNKGRAPDLERFLGWTIPSIETNVDAIHLYQSILTPSGPEYHRLSSFPLGDLS